MLRPYADVIVDITHTAVDRVFQYEIPEELAERAVPGAKVRIPFGQGNRLRDGYIIGFSEKPD